MGYVSGEWPDGYPGNYSIVISQKLSTSSTKRPMCAYIRLMASRVGDVFKHTSHGCTGTTMLGNGAVDPTLSLSLSLSLQ